eukprot:TRINITY_DN12542_c0_g1_i1.p1 TRINITY_DN12542_c0_g1~~TRINITY_DN12542_c0_g1_i1.p1  ORF type:complete len:1023 (+),score=283.21 TRINITY_DN12542_c0_g1_i1:260-3328(+)
MSFQGQLRLFGSADDSLKRNMKQNARKETVKRHKTIPINVDVRRHIEECLQEAKKTGRADFARMNLQEIPPELFVLRNIITELNLSENSLIELTKDIKQFTQLEVLDLSHNQELQFLPEEELGHLRRLHRISIDFSPYLEEKYRNIPSLAEFFHQKVRSQSGRGFSAKIVTIFNNIVPQKKANAETVSAFSYTTKPKKCLHKECERIKRRWKKEILSIHVEGEMRFKGPIQKRPMKSSDFYDLHVDRLAICTRAFRGTYNVDKLVCIRPIYLRSAEKHEFFDCMTSISLSRTNNTNLARIIGIVKYSERRKDIQLEEDKPIPGAPYPVFVLTEFLHPMTLKNWIASPDFENTRLRRKVNFARQIAMGMRALHVSEPTIIHHNLHTNNILFSNSSMNCLKVSDYFLGNRMKRDWQDHANDLENDFESFSIGKEESEYESTGPVYMNSGDTTEEPSYAETESETGDFVENSESAAEKVFPSYVAPELLEGKQYDGKVDVYSFGTVLYELFTGTPADHKMDRSSHEFIRPSISKEFPEGLQKLINRCWDVDPQIRPNFNEILDRLDEIDVECVVLDPHAYQWWLRHFRSKENVEWGKFIMSFFECFSLSSKAQAETEMQKSLHQALDGGDMVSLESFGKMLHWFGPWDEKILERVDTLYRQTWFFGHITDQEAVTMLSPRVRGTYLLRFSPINPGNFILSIAEDGNVNNIEINHQTDGPFEMLGAAYDSLENILFSQREFFNLRFAYPKAVSGDHEISTWEHYTEDERDDPKLKTPLSLKDLSFRFIYTNSQLFPNIKEVLPRDLWENYWNTVIDAITTDIFGREFWKNSFLGKENVKPHKFATKLIAYFAQLDPSQDPFEFMRHLVALVTDIAESPNHEDQGQARVNIETFGKLLEWFGPLDQNFFRRVAKIVSLKSFHGNLSHESAEKHIRHHSAAKKGTYLVRFNTKTRGYFIITVVGRRKALLHYRLHYSKETQEYSLGRRSFSDLEEALSTFSRDLCLFHPCPNSKFEAQGLQHGGSVLE